MFIKLKDFFSEDLLVPREEWECSSVSPSCLESGRSEKLNLISSGAMLRALQEQISGVRNQYIFKIKFWSSIIT